MKMKRFSIAVSSLVLGLSLSLPTFAQGEAVPAATAANTVSKSKPAVVEVAKQQFPPTALVLQSDFGLKDGAVSAMKGVAFGVDAYLPIFDLTHDIPAYNIWEGAYRLLQTAEYWPEGTVFVSVVDPGVGTERGSVVLKTKTGHYFVGPDNGSFGLVAEKMGIEAVRVIDETKNRLQGSEESYTFHGRDVYAYTGARLASGQITFEEVGPLVEEGTVMEIPYQKAELKDGVLRGTIPILDIQYGNIWSNIDKSLFDQWKPKFGDQFNVKIYNDKELVYEEVLPYHHSFGGVAEGESLIYFNSLLNLSLAINWGNFSETNQVFSGPEWSIEITPVKK